MIKTGFFNSINNDRLYNADDLSNFFNGVISDGIIKDYLNSFNVTCDVGSSNLTVTVDSGKALIKGKYLYNTEPIQLSLDPYEGQHIYNRRYDSVVVYINLSSRTGGIKIVKDSFFTNSSEMQETDTYKVIELAGVTVNNDNTIYEFSDKRDDNWARITNLNAITSVSRLDIQFSNFSSYLQYYSYDIPEGMYEPNRRSYIVNVYLNGIPLKRVNSSDDFNIADPLNYSIETINEYANQYEIRIPANSETNLAYNNNSYSQIITLELIAVYNDY